MQNHPADQEPRRVLGSFFAPKSQNTPTWEQRKFSELYEKVSRKNDLTYGKDDIISVANMYYKAESYITDENYLLTYNVFEMGDIAFEGNKSKNFAHGRFVENTIGNGIVSHVFDVFKPRMTNYDLQFWKYAINNERIMGPILLRSTKASTMMTNLVADDFLQENFLIPCYEEQKKIGEFLNQLDTLITLHQRKYEKLVNIKKSMLDKMFPQNGESVPEIRFKGFTDPWEQRKLKELYFQLTERNADLLPYQKTLSVATMSFRTDGNGAADTSLANYKRLRTGDIAFEGHTSKEFRYGRFVLNDVGDGIMSPRFSALRPLHEMPINFWKYYIHYEPIMRKVLVNSTKAGTMMNELVINEFLQESILVPSVAEQQAIGRFFKQLDTLITLHQRKLEKLQNIKKSCLEKMFV